MNEIERIRRDFKPDRIAALFVGESAPRSGKFFYCGNTNLYREMRKAFCCGSDFLRKFQNDGFYLDDLVLHPINGLKKSEKREQHFQGIDSLASRIRIDPPQAIVVVGIGIECYVRLAAEKARFNGPIYVTAFPGRPEHKKRFHEDMGEILPKLLRLRANKEEKMIEGKRQSIPLTEGASRAAARSYLRGSGFAKDDLHKPIIGIANTW
ncbi:MAG TPA: hypothetical protein VJX73_10020, partial [Terracidiphilus sp.]|nr:hypothetical protein [Terracidiphilus sp.]